MAHAARHRLSVKVTAAASLAWARGIEEGGLDALLGDPNVLGGPPEIVARALFGAALPDVGPRWSAKRQRQLESAARRLDHYGGRRGAWVAVAVSVLEAWRAGEIAGWISEPPRSLGALAIELRREANLWRHGALERRADRPARLAARERVKVKCWRRDLRALEHQLPGSGRSLRRPRDL